MPGTEKASIPEETVTSVPEFVAAVARIKARQRVSGNDADLLFRGQPCDKPLLPNLGRCKVNGELLNIERLILEEFERRSLPFSRVRAKKRMGSLGTCAASRSPYSASGPDLHLAV